MRNIKRYEGTLIGVSPTVSERYYAGTRNWRARYGRLIVDERFARRRLNPKPESVVCNFDRANARKFESDRSPFCIEQCGLTVKDDKCLMFVSKQIPCNQIAN